MIRETVISILANVMLITSFVFAGCSALEDNSQPEIDTINDRTLEIGDTRTVSVGITDIDIDDIHTINTSSNNPSVATVTVDEDSLTITGNAVGTATITVTTTDDSGQDNATSLPVTFQVTVNEPPPPPIDQGLCVVGMTLQPGESCTYFANREPVIFYVNEDGGGCRAGEHSYMTEIFGLPVRVTGVNICVYQDIRGDNPFDTNFSADKNSDDSWTIDKVP